MRFITWGLRLLLFLILFLFALKNYEIVSLRFYFDLEWRAPLVLLLLIFFAAGMALGVLACLPRMFRQRRDLTGALAAITRPGPPSAQLTVPAPPVAADAVALREPASPRA